MPRYTFIDDVAPKKVKGVRLIEEGGKNVLVWIHGGKAPKSVMDEPYSYVVYRFAKGEKVNTADPSKIVHITRQCYYELPAGTRGEHTYVVTVLDRMQNESDGVKCKVEL